MILCVWFQNDTGCLKCSSLMLSTQLFSCHKTQNNISHGCVLYLFLKTSEADPATPWEPSPLSQECSSTKRTFSFEIGSQKGIFPFKLILDPPLKYCIRNYSSKMTRMKQQALAKTILDSGGWATARGLPQKVHLDTLLLNRKQTPPELIVLGGFCLQG